MNADGTHQNTANDSFTGKHSTSGYYLRSSARTNKRKFVSSPIHEPGKPLIGGESTATPNHHDENKENKHNKENKENIKNRFEIDPENQENIAPTKMLKNGPLSKIQNLKNLISSGISKITNPTKPEKDIMSKHDDAENEENEVLVIRTVGKENGQNPTEKATGKSAAKSTTKSTKTEEGTKMTKSEHKSVIEMEAQTANINSKQHDENREEEKAILTAAQRRENMRESDLERIRQEALLRAARIKFEGERQRLNRIISREGRENGRKYEYDEKGYIIFHKNLVMKDRYLVVRRLGKGTFSKVFCCIDTYAHNPLDRKVAIKVIRNQHKYQIAARTELRILETLKRGDAEDQFHVIKLVESCYFEQHPIFVFPLYGRSLYHYLYDNNFRPFPDSHIKAISKQIISAVAYTHCLGIIITDLKPENIIICNDASDRHILGDGSTYYTLKSQKVRLIDFGSAVFDDPPHSVHHHLIQTRHYRAPEVMFKFNWSFPADIWSIGCVIVELAHGKMLFNTHDTIDHLNQIKVAVGDIPRDVLHQIDENVFAELFHFDGSLALHRATRSSVQCASLKSYFHDKYHHKIYDLVKNMLVWSTKDRLTAAQALKHPLFKSRAARPDQPLA